MTQCIDGFGAHAIQPNTFLKNFAVEFCTRIHFTYDIHYFAKRNSATVIANGNLFALNGELDCFAIAHGKFVDAVVDDFLRQHIYTVVGTTAVSQLANIHAGTHANMLLPIKRADTFFSVIKQVGPRRL